MFRACRIGGEGARVKERPIKPEFSRTIEVDAVRAEGLEVSLEADAAEREALARRFGLLGLERLSARARLKPTSDGRVRAKVTFEADVLQSCVVTLDPVASHVSDSFEASFAEAADIGGGPEVAFAFEEEEPPEPIKGGRLELGELVAQHLSLALDPYPRKPGAEFRGVADADVEEVEERPFAALARLAARRRR